MRRLKWKDIAPGGEECHFAGLTLSCRRKFHLHDHDFAEFFVLTKGEMLHKVNGSLITLKSGDLVLMRPSDAHEIMTCGKEGFSYVNVAFPASTLSHIKERYFPDAEDFWSGDAPLPARIALGRDALERIVSGAILLSRLPKTRFHIERLILNMLFEIREELKGGAGLDAKELPGWLKRLCEEMEAPERLKAGPRALFRLAGRCKEHVCRSFRSHLGATPTDYVNRLRLQRAEELLLSTDMKLPDIAAECGFGNLGHFHKLFRERFGMTPRRFRLARRSLIV